MEIALISKVHDKWKIRKFIVNRSFRGPRVLPYSTSRLLDYLRAYKKIIRIKYISISGENLF